MNTPFSARQLLVLNNERGQSLILFVFALFITAGFTIQYFSEGLSKYQYFNKEARLFAVRDALEVNLLNKASISGTYRSSLDQSLTSAGLNNKLFDCVLGSMGGSGLANCNANTDHPVSLYSEETDPSSYNSTTLRKISGTGTTPALYDISGNLCAANKTVSDKDCPFEVFTTFRATCKNFAATCFGAETIQVSFTIRAPHIKSSQILSVNVSEKTKLAANVSVSDILPYPNNIALKLTTVSPLVGGRGPHLRSPEVISVIRNAGIKDVNIINTVSDLVDELYLSNNPDLIYAIAKASVDPRMRNYNGLSEFVTLMKDLSITNRNTLVALAQIPWVRNSDELDSIAKAIAAAGTISESTAAEIAHYRITNPTLATAYGIIKDPILISIIQNETRAPWDNNAIASALYVANIDSTKPQLVKALAYARVMDADEASGIANAITTANISNQFIMNSLAAGRVTDPALATQVANTLTALNISNDKIASAIAKGGITDQGYASNFADIIQPRLTEVDEMSFAKSGISDPIVLKSFVDAMIAADKADNEYWILNYADKIKSQNLTTPSDITSLIEPNVTETQVATNPTNQDSQTNESAIKNLQLITGTCTSNCGAPAF